MERLTDGVEIVRAHRADRPCPPSELRAEPGNLSGAAGVARA
ncbi:hypothetical protein ABT294_50305 [Nonomuraea sp. NPDC000554]